jgi:peroxiredoxin
MAVGEPAFDFALYDLDGKFVWLSDLKGKIVIISFWATWCSPCLTEIPDLISAYPALQARGIEILAIDIGEAADVVYRTSRELGMTFPVLLDSSTQLAFAYGLKAIPSSYFIDRDGVLRHIQIGPLTPPALEEILASIE